MVADRPTPARLSRRRMMITAGIAAGGLLTGCSTSGGPSNPGQSSRTPKPVPSPLPSGLSALRTPVAFAAIPFRDGKRQPAMIKVLKPDEFFAADPKPMWTFTGTSGWTSFNGFKFRTMKGRTVALLVSANGRLAIVPAEPSDKADVGPDDAIWQPTKQHNDNPHAAELVPTGQHSWPGGHGTAPYLFIVAAPGDGGSLTVHDVDTGTAWQTPFEGGHGVLWDPKAKRLWALGQYGLSSYRLQKYGKHKGSKEISEHTGSGWGLADARHEANSPAGGHDLQPDYSSNGTHLLATSPGEVFRIPKKHPGQQTGVMLPLKPGEDASYKGSQRVKGIVRSRSGLYVWARMQGHDFNTDAVWTDNAVSVGPTRQDRIRSRRSRW